MTKPGLASLVFSFWSSSLFFFSSFSMRAFSVTVVTHAAQISMPLAELVDLEKEKARMEKELKKNSDELQKLNTKLANPGFVNKAPEHVVKAEQERAVKLTELVAKLEEQLKTM